MTFVANPIQAPKRTMMAMPEHLARLCEPLEGKRNMSAGVRDRLIKNAYETQCAIKRRSKIEQWQNRRAKGNGVKSLTYLESPQRAQRLVELYAKLNGLTVDDMRASARYAHISKPRQEIMWMLFRQTDMSLGAIGTFFDKDHTTVLAAIKGIDQKPTERRRVAALEKNLLKVEFELYG